MGTDPTRPTPPPAPALPPPVLPWPPEAIVEQVVRLELAEDSRQLAGAVTEHPRHRQRGVVVDDAPRHAADVVDRSVVPIAERLRRLRRKGLHERVVAVRQIHDQVVRLAFDAVDDTSASPTSAWASPGGCASGTNISCPPNFCSRTQALTIV